MTSPSLAGTESSSPVVAKFGGTSVASAAQIQKLTEALGVARFVVGHTPQPGQIKSRFDGKVYLIDTGMLSSYVPGGRASALTIQDGKVSTIY